MKRRTERRRYRKVSTRIWGDEKFRNLSPPGPNGQTLWLYLLFGPQTTAIPGLSTTGEASLAETLGWPLAGFRRAWREIETQGMATADWQARVVWIPKAIAHNEPESPNVVRSWRATLDEVPECQLKNIAVGSLRIYIEGLGQAFSKAFDEALRQVSQLGGAMTIQNGIKEPLPLPCDNQEQEQEVLTNVSSVSVKPSGPHIAQLPREQKFTPITEDSLKWFDKVYAAYPKKDRKYEANKQWVTLAPDTPTSMAIFHDVDQRVKAGWKRLESRFIPQLRNYLAERMWEDDNEGQLAPFEDDQVAPHAWQCKQCGVVHEGTAEQARLRPCLQKAS